MGSTVSTVPVVMVVFPDATCSFFHGLEVHRRRDYYTDDGRFRKQPSPRSFSSLLAKSQPGLMTGLDGAK